MKVEEAMELAELKVGVNDRSIMETATVCLYQEVRSLRSQLTASESAREKAEKSLCLEAEEVDRLRKHLGNVEKDAVLWRKDAGQVALERDTLRLELVKAEQERGIFKAALGEKGKTFVDTVLERDRLRAELAKVQEQSIMGTGGFFRLVIAFKKLEGELAVMAEACKAAEDSEDALVKRAVAAEEAIASSRAHHAYDNERKDAALKACQYAMIDPNGPLYGVDSKVIDSVESSLTPSTPAEAEAWKKERELSPESRALIMRGLKEASEGKLTPGPDYTKYADNDVTTEAGAKKEQEKKG